MSVITGTDGNDTLTNAAGVSTINGLAGNDTFIFGANTVTAGEIITKSAGEATLDIRGDNDFSNVTFSLPSVDQQMIIAADTTVIFSNSPFSNSSFDMCIAPSAGAQHIIFRGTNANDVFSLSGFVFDGLDALDSIYLEGGGGTNTLLTDSNTDVTLSCVTHSVSYGFSGGPSFTFSADFNNFELGSGNDVFVGNSSGNTITGGSGNDTISCGAGTDTAIFSNNLSDYTITHSGSTYTVHANSGTDGTDTLTNIEKLQFADKTVNTTIQNLAAAAPQADVTRLTELYVAFFNRVPDADGLAYWIGQIAGSGINPIAESFYNAGVQYSSLTGFSSTMSNSDFVNVVYRNVLGRTGGADADGLAFWSNALSNHTETHGSLVSSILNSAHSFKGDATWGGVADLLDNKIAVAKTFAVDLGLNYNTPSDSISHGMSIAAAVTSTDTAAAIELIGVSASQIQLG